MPLYFTCGVLLAYLALPGVSRGDLIFRCPSCTAERQAACPGLTGACAEIVREPGCGCCPVCARTEGEFCGVYTPRCSTGLRCYPSADSDLPLEELVLGLGRCSQKVDLERAAGQDYQDTNGEMPSTESPQQRRPPPKDSAPWRDLAVQQHHNDLKAKMKTTRQEDTRTQGAPPQSPCQQELHKVLVEISRMTFLDNRGPLENLYQLKFPNCDRQGNYNLKQCNISTHGQRGECWCVDPATGVRIPMSPRIRGDPNCNQFLEEQRETGPPLPTSMVLWK